MRGVCLTAWICTMCGCDRPAAICASRLNRATIAPRPISSGSIVLMATFRFSDRSVARYTAAMPPRPSSERISYSPAVASLRSGRMMSRSGSLLSATVGLRGGGVGLWPSVTLMMVQTMAPCALNCNSRSVVCGLWSVIGGRPNSLCRPPTADPLLHIDIVVRHHLPLLVLADDHLQESRPQCAARVELHVRQRTRDSRDRRERVQQRQVCPDELQRHDLLRQLRPTEQRAENRLVLLHERFAPKQMLPADVREGDVLADRAAIECDVGAVPAFVLLAQDAQHRFGGIRADLNRRHDSSLLLSCSRPALRA